MISLTPRPPLFPGKRQRGGRKLMGYVVFLILACLPLLFYAISSACAAAPLPQEPIPLDEYWARLHATRRALETLSDADPQNRRAVMDQLAQDWEAIVAIQVPGADPIPIDNTPLIAALRRDPPEPVPAIRLVDQLLEYELKWGKMTFNATHVEALQAILSRPEFQWQSERPNPLQQLWRRLVEALIRLLDRIFGNRAVQVGVSYGQYVWIILGALAALLVLLLASRGLWRSMIQDEALVAEGEALDQITADGAMRRAQELSSAGDYRQGVRYLYLSALLLLEEHGLLRYDRSRTNREVLHSVANRPELLAPLQRVVDVFDRVWYGYQSIGQEDFAAYTEDVAELRRQK